ncbi:MAG: head-tail joining protein [Kofleriaceae bacterium]
MMSFDELVAETDRAALSDLGGETVTYTPEVGSPVPVTGMFDEQYVLAKGTAEAGVEATGPAVFLRLEDLPVHPDDDEPTLTIKSVDYRVIERRPDGMGGIVLALRRVG